MYENMKCIISRKLSTFCGAYKLRLLCDKNHNFGRIFTTQKIWLGNREDVEQLQLAGQLRGFALDSFLCHIFCLEVIMGRARFGTGQKSSRIFVP